MTILPAVITNTLTDTLTAPTVILTAATFTRH